VYVSVCTCLRLSAENGAIVVGRTMEFGNLTDGRYAVRCTTDPSNPWHVIEV